MKRKGKKKSRSEKEKVIMREKGRNVDRERKGKVRNKSIEGDGTNRHEIERDYCPIYYGEKIYSK